MVSYREGDDYLEENASVRTYGITELNGDNSHYDKIEIHGDPYLREKIIKLLNQEDEKGVGMKRKVKRLIGDLYRVICVYEQYGKLHEEEEFRGSISECDSYIRLKEQGYID